jgi:hypothetical protein
MNDNNIPAPDHDNLCEDFVIKSVDFIMAEEDENAAINLMAYILGNVAGKSTDPKRIIKNTFAVALLVLASYAKIKGDAT